MKRLISFQGSKQLPCQHIFSSQGRWKSMWCIVLVFNKVIFQIRDWCKPAGNKKDSHFSLKKSFCLEIEMLRLFLNGFTLRAFNPFNYQIKRSAKEVKTSLLRLPITALELLQGKARSFTDFLHNVMRNTCQRASLTQHKSWDNQALNFWPFSPVRKVFNNRTRNKHARTFTTHGWDITHRSQMQFYGVGETVFFC